MWLGALVCHWPCIIINACPLIAEIGTIRFYAEILMKDPYTLRNYVTLYLIVCSFSHTHMIKLYNIFECARTRMFVVQDNA